MANGDIVNRIIGNGSSSSRNANMLRGRSDASRSGFQNVLNQLLTRSRNIQEEGRLTPEDLFGDSIARIFDSTGASANATKQALSRAILGGGGDISGSAGAQILGVDQATAGQRGEALMGFERLAESINRQQQGRADQLLSQGLQGFQNLLTFDENALQTLLTRDIQREQARKQRRQNLLGSILQGAGSLGSAAILACWVAEELYGKDSPKVANIRKMLFENEGKPNAYGEFLEEYKEKGRTWAKMVRDHRPLRMKALKLFDKLYEVSIA